MKRTPLTVVRCGACKSQEPPIFLHKGQLWCADCLAGEDLDLFARCQLTKKRAELLREQAAARRQEFQRQRQASGWEEQG